MISGLRICAVNCVVVTTFVAIGFWSPAPAAAQTQQQIDWCLNQGSPFPPDLQIGGCTASIQSGRWSGKALAWVYVSRGHAFHDKKDYDRAIADYDQAIQLDPKDANAYVSRGLAYHGKKDYDRAIADYNQAIQLDPKDADAYFSRGLAKRRKGDNSGGDADIAVAKTIDPNVGN
jgi:tetratricopeptide (TPR) repeat protein